MCVCVCVYVRDKTTLYFISNRTYTEKTACIYITVLYTRSAIRLGPQKNRSDLGIALKKKKKTLYRRICRSHICLRIKLRTKRNFKENFKIRITRVRAKRSSGNALINKQFGLGIERGLILTEDRLCFLQHYLPAIIPTIRSSKDPTPQNFYEKYRDYAVKKNRHVPTNIT